MCASPPWCYTKGALRATLRHFLEMEVELLCCANVREPAMVPYQGGSASNIGVLFSQLRVKIVVPQVSEMSLLRCDVVLAGCKQVSGPRGQDEILLLKLHLIVVCMRISLRTSSSSYVRPDTWRIVSGF